MEINKPFGRHRGDVRIALHSYLGLLAQKEVAMAGVDIPLTKEVLGAHDKVIAALNAIAGTSHALSRLAQTVLHMVRCREAVTSNADLEDELKAANELCSILLYKFILAFDATEQEY